MKNKILSLLIIIFATVSLANAQTTEIKITLDEQFFDTLLEAVFTHLDEPSVPIASKAKESGEQNGYNKLDSDDVNQKASYQKVAFSAKASVPNSKGVCDESIKLKREIAGVRTAVRFRQGKIYAPIAFLGNYSIPLIGCVEFRGWAETNINLSFDKNKNALIGIAKVLNVHLSGTGGIGSGVVTRFVQSSIDKKVNPIEIIKLDKLSFVTPIQKSGKLRMNALGVRHRVNSKSLDVYIKYEFLKG